MIVVNSLSENNVYFIFRENNQEVKVDISSGRLKSDNRLRPEERKYFYDEIMKRDDINLEVDEELEAINNLAEQGYNDYYIAKKLGLNYSYVVQMTTQFWKDKMSDK